jgi:hypothetical protein
MPTASERWDAFLQQIERGQIEPELARDPPKVVRDRMRAGVGPRGPSARRLLIRSRPPS